MTHALKPPCPICGNLEAEKIRFVENNTKVCRVQCDDCKTIYFDRQPPYEPKYGIAYNRHFFRPGDIRKAGIMAATIAEIANERYFGPRILEAGTGNGLTVFLLKHMDIHAEAVEIDADNAECLAGQFDIKIHVARFEDWKTDSNWEIIYSSHVIEHTRDPKGFLKKAYDLLTPGGLLYLETPDVQFNSKLVKRWHHFATRDPYEHVILFGTPGIYMLLGELGLTNIRIESIPEYQILRIQAEKAK